MEKSKHFVSVSRRRLMLGGFALALAPLLPDPLSAEPDTSELQRITDDASPISVAEREGRIDRARKLMRANGIDAILIEPGASLAYFTGIDWWRSERLTAAILFATGNAVIVTPFFEEASVRETLAVPADVRVWQEDESPIALLAGALKERGLANGTVGIEETVRFFASDGLARMAPGLKVVSANSVVHGCRMIKTPAEIALMTKATEVTIAAYRWVWPRIKIGMAPDEISTLMNAATVKLGGAPEFSLVLMGEAASYPHGSRKPQRVREGEVVLMDCGCTVQGYQSDVSRTFVPGKVPVDVRDVWDTVHEGQQIAFRTARVGVPAGHVDDAVRAFYEKRGFGPRYHLPGLSHRTGHGIGLDGHEPVNLVHNEPTLLQPGMCFSDEPGLYLPGRFGVRLEDCFHMTESGPAWFSTPPTSLEKPV
jgi:Xaa-Pro dipeptidase